LEVSVSDLGQGFDPQAETTEGLGLAGLRERVESLGDEFDVQSSRSGTRLTVRLKLAQKEAV
jgi:signal transduction histidine kinase